MTDTLFPPSVHTVQLLDRLGRLLHELQFVDGLNPAQWEALRYISRANLYSRSPGALAEFLGTTRGTVSQTLISLENKGYVRRERSAADRRVVRLELTEGGAKVLEKDPMRAIEQAAACLDTATGDALRQGLNRLLCDVQGRFGLKPFGVCGECALFCSGEADRTRTKRLMCGLTGEALEPRDIALLCVNYRAI